MWHLDSLLFVLVITGRRAVTPRFTHQPPAPYERARGAYRTANDPNNIGYAGKCPVITKFNDHHSIQIPPHWMPMMRTWIYADATTAALSIKLSPVLPVLYYSIANAALISLLLTHGFAAVRVVVNSNLIPKRSGHMIKAYIRPGHTLAPTTLYSAQIKYSFD